ncbi:MAG: Ig-like domain-containing protein, partial [Lachnospiraceae bacterium]|nr:Ig-like domain-containing protein [Lachnospiraceae bacterium]
TFTQPEGAVKIAATFKETEEKKAADKAEAEKKAKEEAEAEKQAYVKRIIAMNEGASTIQKSDYIKTVWNKVDEADYYVVYITRCGDTYKNGDSYVIKDTDVTDYTIRKFNGKNLDLKNNYKVVVAAYKKTDKGRVRIARTLVSHITGTTNATYTNPSELKLEKKSVSLKTGKTYKIKGKVTLADSKKTMLSDKHAATLRYLSSDTKVATVTKSGKIKAVGKGKCYVYVYTNNGFNKKVKVTVK